MSIASRVLIRSLVAARSSIAAWADAAAASEASSSSSFAATTDGADGGVGSWAAASLRGAARLLASSAVPRGLNGDGGDGPTADESVDDVLAIEDQEALDHFIDSQGAHAVASVASVFAILLSAHLMYRHLQYYARPLLQRQIIRIVMIVPVYAFCSALSLAFDHYAPYINARE
jgi:hypothetical protein